MRLSRAGFLMLPLLLAACSLPVKQTTTPSTPVEQAVKNDTTNITDQDNKAQVTAPAQEQKADEDTSQEALVPSHQELIKEFDSIRTVANQNIAELKTRSGAVPEKPSIMISDRYDREALMGKIEEVKAYNQTLVAELKALDSRVEQRRQRPQFGDVIQVYLSDLKVESEKDFSAQPLIGNWVRGESRVVRLNENMLMENSTTEPMRLTFTEAYQIVINGTLVGTFGPNNAKHEMSFEASTADLKGSIEGSLATRIQGS
ncbi:hypothetical protein ACFQ45_03185 [Rhodanobacter aciditrophus]|uniref:DUF3450 domain-containing protein n=1 Tax=Rhodanobacter aciditrophus TaxID=1623218 RepID=A0ABW4AYL6_9GAMM